MTDFLLELRSEEIPARMQVKAKEDLARLFNDALAKAGLAAEGIETFATPRRLSLIAKGLPMATEAVAEETKGPKVGAPPQAMDGFLRKTGLTQDRLVERDGVYFAVVEKAGRNTADVLGEAIPAIIRAFPWPKSQRWGAASVSTESLRWVRPLQGIVALLGNDVVECEIDGIVSGAATMGHRFHHKGPITIGNAGDYIEKLREAHVIVHFSERCAIIRDGAKAAAEAAGLTMVEDEGLVAENAGLTEWPVPMLGRFDPAFLEVPQEVIQLTARVNQKYFVCHDATGKLANAFVCTANIVANDGGAAIVAGNEKVLAARLSDAKFFWEQDLKVALETQAKKLSQITFHEKLGTVADKVERVAKLARWLVEEGIVTSPLPFRGGAGGGVSPSGAVFADKPHPNPSPEGEGLSLADQAERAARLCKADLVTGMVGEFPELQGIMGGYYARAQGESDAVADAIRDHYKPVGQGDDVPTAPVTVAVSLADKLDTLVGFFAIGQLPTGSKDPYALRRLMLGLINTVEVNRLRFPLHSASIYARNLILETFSAERWVVDPDDEDEYILPLILKSGDEARSKTVLIYPYEASRYSEDYDRDELVFSEQYDAGKQPPVKFWGAEDTATDLKHFMLDRLRVRLREEGIRFDVIDALIPKAPKEIDLDWLLQDVDDWLNGQVRLGSYVSYRPSDQINAIQQAARSLNKLLVTPVGLDALYVYRRSVKILAEAVIDQNNVESVEVGASEEVMTLARWLDELDGNITSALALRDLRLVIEAIASGKQFIDAFFDNVVVNDPDLEKRAFRLGLLARFRDAVHRVADFSKIEG